MKKKKQFKFITMNIHKMIDGKKYQFMGIYPKNDDFISSMERTHNKIGFVIKVEPDDFDKKKIRMWSRKR